MMCSCEQEFGRAYLPHQISAAQELQTRNRVPVTMGFQPCICRTCRGLPEVPHPKRPTHGSTTKVARYYWREIQKSTIKSFARWAQQQGYPDWLQAMLGHRDEYEKYRREAIAEIKELHKRSPKYVYDDRSQSAVIAEYSVPVVRLEGIYRKTSNGRLRIESGQKLLAPEDFVAKEYREQGYETLFTESVPLHALFAVMMWPLIQDPGDPRVRVAMFGDRIAFEEGSKGEVVHAPLPADFGAPGYSSRRENAIRKHIASLPVSKQELLRTFDHWLQPSMSLRQYLWAHRPSDVQTARTILSVLPGESVRRILQYLVGDYWSRYLGWPDLIIHRDQAFCFIEVKSSKDGLSEEQKHWIQGNAEHLGLPFKIVKIHKKARN